MKRGSLEEALGLESSSCVWEAKKTVGYVELEFRVTVQAGEVHLGVDSILCTVNACMNEWNDNAKMWTQICLT